MKLITFDDIKRLNISPSDCYNWVCETLENKSKAILPPKISLKPIEHTFTNIMPCFITNSKMGLVGITKIVNRYPDRVPALDSMLILIDGNTGEYLALMDANLITALRTGAVAANSIKLLAKSNFRNISMLGLGNTARAALMVLAHIYQDREFNVKLLRYKNQEESFKDRFKDYNNLHFSYADSYEELIKGSEVVISCVTYFEDDICSDDCFDEGVLVVPVHTRGFSNCDLFFDKVFADDYGHVHHFKNFDKFKSFAEVADIICGKVAGRENDKQRILAYNIGLSIHDANYAAYIYDMLKDDDSIANIDLKAPKEKFWL